MDTNKQLNGGDAERQVASGINDPRESTTPITDEQMFGRTRTNSAGITYSPRDIDAERQVASGISDPREAPTAITVELPVNFAEAFRSLAEREGLSEGDLIVRSLGLYSVASQAESEGYGLTFTRIEGTNDLTAKEAIRIEDEPVSNLFIPGKR
jgi:hypothetical protein